MTHVCRRWRAIALNCPTLWDVLNSDDSYNLLLWKLVYSERVPLQVNLPTTFARVEGTAKLLWEKVLVEEMYRVSRLFTRGWLPSEHIAPSSQLEGCDLALESCDNIKPFLGILDGSKAPGLRSLRLYWHPWPFALISHVHHPKLTTLAIHIGHPLQPPDDILRLLASIPTLESLAISSSNYFIEPHRTSRTSRTWPKNCPVLMPYLRELSLIEMNMRSAFTLMELLNVLQCTAFDLQLPS